MARDAGFIMVSESEMKKCGYNQFIYIYKNRSKHVSYKTILSIILNVEIYCTKYYRIINYFQFISKNKFPFEYTASFSYI